MLEELIRAVSATAGLTPEQAALAVTAVLRFFTARMPSALVGELHERLGTRLQAGAAARPRDPTPPQPPRRFP